MKKYLKDRLIVIPIILVVFGGWMLLASMGFQIDVAIPAVLLLLIWIALIINKK